MSKFCFKNTCHFENRGCEAHTHSWSEHHIHTSSHPPPPQFLQNPTALIQKNLRLPKQYSEGWNLLALFVVQNHHGSLSFAHGAQKIWIMAALWQLPSFELRTCRTFPTDCMAAQGFQNLTLSKATTKSLLLPQTFQKRQLSCHLASLNTFPRLLDCLTFQRMMDRTLDSLEGMFPNMDDS
jgi:hypothetical protein